MSRCALACWLGLIACVLPLLRRLGPPPKRRPASVVCYAGRACDATSESFDFPETAEGALVYGVHGPDLSEAEHERVVSTLKARFEATARSGSTSTTIHIGPNVLWPHELEFYERLFGSCRDCRLVFVEPQPAVLAQLERQVRTRRGLGLGDDRVSFLNAAMCVGATAQLTMFRLDVRICRDFPRRRSCPFAANRSLMRTSMDKDYVLREVFKFGAREGLPNLTMEELGRYIESFTVPCFTALGLLESLQAGAAQLDFVTVDAEGHDEEIVEMLLSLEGFSPAVLKFEWSYGSRGDRLVRLVASLADRGYDVHKSQQDLVAVRGQG